jgi:hypothetical protein
MIQSVTILTIELIHLMRIWEKSVGDSAALHKLEPGRLVIDRADNLGTMYAKDLALFENYKPSSKV